MKKCLALLLLLSLAAAQASEQNSDLQKTKKILQKLKNNYASSCLRNENSFYCQESKELFDFATKSSLRDLRISILIDPREGALNALDLGYHPNTVIPKYDTHLDYTKDIMGETVYSTLIQTVLTKQCPLAGLHLLLQAGGNPHENYSLPKEALTAQQVLDYSRDHLPSSQRASSCANKIQELFDEKKLELNKRLVKEFLDKKNL
ncbi:MAG: hypothetical protein AB7R69_01655 [Candidatus Babeliales bacterium]